MKNLKQLREELGELQIRAMAIVKQAEEEGRELTAEEQAVIDEAADSPLKEQIRRAERIDQITAELGKQVLAPKLTEKLEISESAKPVVKVKSAHVGKLRAFQTHEEAYGAGMFALGYIMGRPKAQQWCKEHGFAPQQVMTEADNTRGGFAVPEPLENAIIILREQYGVLRRNMNMIWPLNAGNLTVPKLTGEVTTYYVGENTAPTVSAISMGSVKLQAKKLACLVGPISNELQEDAVISIGELVAGSMAQQFAYAEDDAAFNGTGANTYGGIVGFITALAAGSIATAGSGRNTWASLLLADFHAAKARIRPYPGAVNKWYTHSEFYYSVMEPLQVAAGGNTVADVANGGEPRFLGLPVEFTQVLPRVSAASTNFAYVGDIGLAAVMGSARGMTVRTSTERFFSEDALAILGTERYDFQIHEPGTASIGGPVVALRTAA